MAILPELGPDSAARAYEPIAPSDCIVQGLPTPGLQCVQHENYNCTETKIQADRLLEQV